MGWSGWGPGKREEVFRKWRGEIQQNEVKLLSVKFDVCVHEVRSVCWLV